MLTSDFLKEFGRLCLADPLTTLYRGLVWPCVVALYRLDSWHGFSLYRGIASPCVAALYRLVSDDRGLVSWHCITMCRGLAFSHHLGPNLSVRLASPIASNGLDQ